MCGIWARLGRKPENESVEYWVQRLRARGPEGMSLSEGDGWTLGFTRLAINGLTQEGMQPKSFGTVTYACNGEIYNWRDLAKRYEIDQEACGSDCGVLGELWEKFRGIGTGTTFFQALDGVFAMVLIDSAAGVAYVARDPYGVRPLFVGYKLGKPTKEPEQGRSYVNGSDGEYIPIDNIYFASEMKAIQMCDHLEVFPPGHCAAYDLKSLGRLGFEPYHTIPWLKNPNFSSVEDASVSLRVALEMAVKKRMMTDRPVAALLSGGLDSSLIAALVQKNLNIVGAAKLKTFSIGFEGSEDLRNAKLVADHIGSDHTEIVMTPEEFWDAVPEVIADIESFDITTVRASVGNWLVSKYIKEHSDCKVVFNGDGSDEVMGGYLYFHNAPSDEAFEAESERLLKDMHMFDVLRSDRSISSHGLEARTPFLDKQFVGVARSIPTWVRRPRRGLQVEKWILRRAFQDSGLLPDEVLWRRKEAFSDGVSGGDGKSWYQICQEKAEKSVQDSVLPWEKRAESIKHLTPKTAEAFYYRWLFNKKYGKKYDFVMVPYYWMPKWCPETSDPSAKTLAQY